MPTSPTTRLEAVVSIDARHIGREDRTTRVHNSSSGGLIVE